MKAAAFMYKGECIDMVATMKSIDSGDMQNIGKLTPARLNFPENIVLPIYLTTSLKAVRYLFKTTGSFSGKPPSFATSGCLQSSTLSIVLKFLANSSI